MKPFDPSFWYNPAMGMRPFHDLFPDVAKKESRTLAPINQPGLPNHTFIFLESYCVEPRCDCRRLILNVVDTTDGKHVATINHAFEPPKAPFEDERQTMLDLLNPQTAMADGLLELFQDMIDRDQDYRERLERHYAMWKAVVDDPTHPDHHKVRTEEHDDPDFRPAFPRQQTVRRDGPKIGPNEPCPCGSGKKFKKCCRG